MTRDINKPRYRKLYREEFDLAAKALAGRNGALDWSTADYVAFVWTEPAVCLVFYPHKTSAGNHHIRVRDQGSRDKALARELMRRLDEAAGYNRTFTQKMTRVRA